MKIQIEYVCIFLFSCKIEQKTKIKMTKNLIVSVDQPLVDK